MKRHQKSLRAQQWQQTDEGRRAMYLGQSIAVQEGRRPRDAHPPKPPKIPQKAGE